MLTIRNSDHRLLASTAGALMHTFSKAKVAAGFPDGAEVFSNNVSGQDRATECIFFFSPKAVEIAKDVLHEFSPERCQQPDIAALRKVRL